VNVLKEGEKGGHTLQQLQLLQSAQLEQEEQVQGPMIAFVLSTFVFVFCCSRDIKYIL